jgi:hypothetical protein
MNDPTLLNFDAETNWRHAMSALRCRAVTEYELE